MENTQNTSLILFGLSSEIKAPPRVWKLIQDFWEKNKDQQTLENWGAGNTYTNNWQAPTYMVSVEDSKLRGGGRSLKKSIWEAARETISEWTGQELTESSLYGIRVYQEGAVLMSHVDRLPLVSSAIINVAQDGESLVVTGIEKSKMKTHRKLLFG